jgi:hypothetical protein
MGDGYVCTNGQCVPGPKPTPGPKKPFWKDPIFYVILSGFLAMVIVILALKKRK